MDYFVWNMNPVLIDLGFTQIYWYGLLFASAFISSYSVMTWIYRREGKDEASLDDMLWYIGLGTLIGARVGHCLFYDPSYYFNNPLKIIAIWEGGLASHGAIIGILSALYLFQRKHAENYLWFLDRAGIAGSLGASFVRMGNFFNSEIVGVPTSVPWAVIFSRLDFLPRHPVQLYESISYLGVFILLVLFYRKKAADLREGVIFSAFLIGIFLARFLLEFLKTKQEAYTNELWFSTGQLLSLPFILAGILFILSPYFKGLFQPK